MEFREELDFDEVESTESVDGGIEVEEVSESSIIPKEGTFLGLDISESSSGICIYTNGVKRTYTIALEEPSDGIHREVLLRRQLKSRLAETLENSHFDLIIIEDAYQGIDPTTTRLLYALNTAIDELILDGVITVETFVRVNNRKWKSWLFKVDKEHRFKGLNDKVRIQKCLELLGVTEEGRGFQDKLDSCGMLIGYFLYGDKGVVEEVEKVDIDVKDICYAYEEDPFFIQMEVAREDICTMYIEEKKVNKELVKRYLERNPDRLFITESPIKLGNYGKSLGLPCLIDGGFFGFWIRSKALNKYM